MADEQPPQPQTAAPQDTPVIRPPATAAQAASAPAGEDPGAAARAKAAELRAQAAELEASNPPPDTVMLKVEDPHMAFAFGGAAVGTDWTPVHQALVPGVMQAASEAGVTLTQKE